MAFVSFAQAPSHYCVPLSSAGRLNLILSAELMPRPVDLQNGLSARTPSFFDQTFMPLWNRSALSLNPHCSFGNYD